MDDAGLPDKASTTRFAFGWVGSSLWYCQIAGENLRVLICLPAFGKLHKKYCRCLLWVWVIKC
ncbi:hypothetical protein FEM48_Zijuj08G0196700 [Ziziphus jujuba var. spinosa]|uniref:Uncharacterized protein n=1 Tax=Ziziphus jujuba var. spinosa TaxID=714518 RepID=A0A978V103_ZIZJJ|nr:hypothetical protein FEM48_Zijuj08G0196700 [Ziziphus jujuba var. spinosa]